MKMRTGIAALVGLAGLTGMSAEAAPPSRPNIVLLLADDLGYGDTSFMGATKLRTPNIDRLASQGVHFTDAHSSGAVCQPTRYGILTGRYHWRGKRTGNGYYFQDREVLLPEVLRQHGYATAAFGKWHLGWGLQPAWDADFWNRPVTHGPRQAGFDYFFGQASGHEWPPFVWIENDRVYRGETNDPISIIKENPAHWPYAGGQGSSRGGKAAHDAYEVERLDLTVAERAVQWMAEQPKDKPFFAYVPFFAPHVPLLPSAQFKGSSGAGLLGDFIQQLDHAVGIVLAGLAAQGRAENTLVVFTSDNGGCYIRSAMDLGHRSMGRLLGLKGDAWEGGHRVPFIARWPGRIPSGTTCDKLLSSTDLFPTFAAAAGVELPRSAAPDGMNQLPLWLHPHGTPAIRQEMVYGGRSLALRSGDWVYHPHPGAGGLFGTFYLKQLDYTHSDFAGNQLRPDAPATQLYNLQDDPGQATNVVAAHPAVAAQLAARLNEITRQTKSK